MKARTGAADRSVELPSEARDRRAQNRLRRRQTPVVDSRELLGMMGDLHWYALRTPAQKEFVAQELLTQKGVVTFCPTDKRWRKRNRYQKTKELISYAMIPRTLFAGFDPGVPAWLDIFALRAVSSVVGIAGKPMRLDSAGMVRLISKFPNGVQRPDEEKHMQTGKEFKAGDVVRVLGGPFDGMTVPVYEIRGKDAKVFIDLFGSTHEVAISTWMLEAAA